MCREPGEEATMAESGATPIQQVLDEIEKLETDEQHAVIEIVRRRLIERRRTEIAENARQAVQAVREGKTHYGTVDDLQRDLLSEP
jgi:deoxyribodipyrimidine photolyase